MRTIYPLKNGWKVEEDSGLHPTEQIQRRVDSEDNYTWGKNYPLIKNEDIIKINKK